jgi:predicted nucleotidyltransferase
MALADDIVLYNFWARLKEFPFVEALYLFGSRASGKNAPRADIDITVSCPAADSLDWARLMDCIDEADTLLPIDCVRLETADPVLQGAVREKGMLLYRKEGCHGSGNI